jgi:TM2 domain-containing membrane protein YozV
VAGEQKSNEKKLTLLLLCWLFGLFAVHRFYTGKYPTGALQLLLITLIGVSALFEAEILPAIGLAALFIWWIIDMARIIMGKFTDKAGRRIVDWV